MSSPLAALGVSLPVLAAPMAGGPSTPQLVAAAARAGGLGFLAGGYQSPDALAAQMAQARVIGVAFGVNLFAPNPVPVDPEAFGRYARAIAPAAERYGVDLLEVPLTEDDDHWSDKVELLLSEPVPVAGFTFGVPRPGVVDALRGAGTLVMQTVTSAEEAQLAESAGVDMLTVQASAAGGHSGTFTPGRPVPDTPLCELLGQVCAVTSLPLVAAGGLATPEAVARALRAGAAAVMVGTVLLRADESGASRPHRAAVGDQSRGATVITRAFTGRPARALRNQFTDRFSGVAPEGYPAVHHLTSPLRRASAAAGNPEWINLWAGTGYRRATAEPTAHILRRLTTTL
ncbi:MAG: nitronate monooxygenase [Pseudonocardiaceae bacterium]